MHADKVVTSIEHLAQRMHLAQLIQKVLVKCRFISTYSSLSKSSHQPVKNAVNNFLFFIAEISLKNAARDALITLLVVVEMRPMYLRTQN